MNIVKICAAIAGTMILASSTAAFAQDQRENVPNPGLMRQQSDREALRSRERDDARIDARQRSSQRQPRPEQVARDAQAAATAAGLSCRVTESSYLGETDQNAKLYEVACAGDVGHIIQASNPPTTFDCLVLANQADRVRASGQEPATGSFCALPGNQNALGVLTGYAQQAGVPCTVDAGRVVGKTQDGNVVYEIGCANADGYHIERTASGWNKTDCLQVMSTNLTCEFTTPEEQVAWFKPLLAGTDIDDCDPRNLHLLAQNDTGRFIEVKCASGDGWVARVKDNAVGQVYACAVAVRIGGGCTLTRVED